MNLRYIMRDGEKVLQYCPDTIVMPDAFWADVPVVVVPPTDGERKPCPYCNLPKPQAEPKKAREFWIRTDWTSLPIAGSYPRQQFANPKDWIKVREVIEPEARYDK